MSHGSSRGAAEVGRASNIFLIRIRRQLALSVRREFVEHRGWVGPAEWPNVAQIGPEPRRLRSALSWREHRHGRVVGVLTIVDTFTRYAPAIEPRFGYRAGDVVDVLERVGREHGFPHPIIDLGAQARDLVAADPLHAHDADEVVHRTRRLPCTQASWITAVSAFSAVLRGCRKAGK
jgi:hypothetical protein